MTPDEFQAFVESLSERERAVLEKRVGPLSPESLGELGRALPETLQRLRELERRFGGDSPTDEGPSVA